jgi:tetrahydromethanopterin S-methyltransferase subunit G
LSHHKPEPAQDGFFQEAKFAVTDLKTGATTEVLYPSVAQVKGQNVASGAKIAIWVGVAVGVTLLVIWITLMAVRD